MFPTSGACLCVCLDARSRSDRLNYTHASVYRRGAMVRVAIVAGLAAAAALSAVVAGVDWDRYGAADQGGDNGGGGGGGDDAPQACGAPPPEKTPYDDYNFEDPKGDHTQMAIKMDEDGYPKMAIRAFAASAHFDPTPGTLTNYGVSLMRAGELDAAFAQMYKAHDIAFNEGDVEHVHSNLINLKTWFTHKKKEPEEPWPLREDAGGGDRGGGEVEEAEATQYQESARQKSQRKPLKRSTKKAGKKKKKKLRPELLHQRRVPLGVPMQRVRLQEHPSLLFFFFFVCRRRACSPFLPRFLARFLPVAAHLPPGPNRAGLPGLFFFGSMQHGLAGGGGGAGADHCGHAPCAR